jgi:hypothetical protein
VLRVRGLELRPRMGARENYSSNSPTITWLVGWGLVFRDPGDLGSDRQIIVLRVRGLGLRPLKKLRAPARLSRPPAKMP